jgi:acyl-CoA-binding protein
MALAEDFNLAQVRVKKLTKLPEAGELLELYALFKQATVGDVQGKRPGMLDIKGRAKHDAWTSKKSMAKDAAMKEYVAVVERLEKKYR